MAKKDKQKHIKIIFIIILIGFVGYVWYFLYNIIFAYMLNSEKEKLWTEITNVKTQIEWITNTQNYWKLSMAKFISSKESNISWSDNIKELIVLFNTISRQSSELEWNIWWLELSDFNINGDNINFAWTISDIEKVYKDEWVIDQFANLDFIDTMEIPFYRKQNTGDKTTVIKFNLNAKIK